jgi:hypothetical protein
MASAHAARVAAIANANLLNNNTNLMLSNLRGAKDEAIGYVDTAEPLQLNTLHDAYGQARDAYGTAKTEFQPYVDQGRQAGDLYNGSVGLGGATGHDAAVAAYRASPGYEYQVEQASDAVARKNASLGIAGSGNTQAAIADRVGHMADQEYGSWQDRLDGINRLGYAATGAQANMDRGIGDLYANEGQGVAGVYGNDAARKAGITTGIAGQSAAGLSHMTDSLVQGNNNVATATQKANDDTTNMWLNIGKLGASLAGTAAGGSLGGLGGGLSKLTGYSLSGDPVFGRI